MSKTSSHSAPRRKGRIGVVLVIAALAIGGYGYFHYGKSQPQEEKTARSISVLYEEAVLKDMPVEVKALGTLSANATVTVTSRIDGQLMKLHFTDGQYVQEGQLLAELDTRTYQATKAQYEGQLAKDNAQLRSEKRKYERYQQLFQNGAISRQDLDTQRASSEGYEGSIKSDQAQIAAAALNISFGRIVAPISGYTGLHQVDVGNMVHSSDTTGIVTITQTQPMALTFSVPERYLSQIMGMLRDSKTMPVQVMDAFGRSVLAQGAVSYASNQIDINTGSIKLKALLPNTDNQLYPNQSVSVTLQLGMLHNAIVVPTGAVQWNDDGSFVYVIGDGDHIRKASIATGPVSNGYTVIDSGVQAGERVVIQGIDRLSDGVKVSPLKQSDEAAAKPEAQDKKA
ncbi:efflux RND transporter periplasmic adaptor subunit [Zymobacter sp. IVIA_12111.31 C1]|uniref:efflux RND transporter periplasmic adaptor subunit n=1 Tax=Zymobacter sp. IVIA_12111.31 C1 TaxID=3394854 RepID=UPI0039C41BDF